MGAPLAARLLVLAPAPSNRAMLELLRSMLAQRLIDPPEFVHGAEVVRLAARPEGDEFLPLAERLAGAPSGRLVLFDVVPADAEPPTWAEPDGVLGVAGEGTSPLTEALRVDRFIRDALAVPGVDAAVGQLQELHTVNLLLPAAGEGSMGLGLWASGPLTGANATGWANVVVVPEVQEQPGQAVVPVDPDENYVAHATAALVTLAGLWSGAPWSPDFGAAPESGHWTAVRTRSRSLLAPELPMRVVGRVASATAALPVDDDVHFDVVPDPPLVCEEAIGWLVASQQLRPTELPDTAPRFGRRRVTLLGYLRILWQWVTGRLPGLIEQRVRDQLLELRDAGDRMLNGIVGLNEQHDLVIAHGPADAGQAGPVDGPSRDADRSLPNWGFAVPEPRVWTSLRELSFSLLDGGPLTSERLRSLLGEGPNRYVIGDRADVVPRIGAPGWVPSPELAGHGPAHADRAVDVAWLRQWSGLFERLADARAGRPSPAPPPVAPTAPEPPAGPPPLPEELLALPEELLVEEERRFRAAARRIGESLHGRFHLHLDGCREDVSARADALRAELAAARAEMDEPEAVLEEHRAERRRLLRRLAVGLVLVVAVSAVAVGGAVTLLVGTALAVSLLVIASLSLVGALRQLVRCAYGWFLAEHRLRWRLHDRAVVVTEALRLAEWQERRFRQLGVAGQDWTDAVSVLCHEPFGPPRIVRRPRIRHLDLHLPVSHQVREGTTTEPRLDGLVAAVSADLLRPGWLAATFGKSLDFAREEHRLRSRGGDFDPDRDVSVADQPAGPRRHLVDALRSGRARRRGEYEVMQRVERALRSGEGFIDDDRPVEDRLFTPLDLGLPDPVVPSTFLSEAVAGVPDRFNFSHANAALPLRFAEQVRGQVELPDLPTTEELIEGGDVEFPAFAFTSWAIDALPDLPGGELNVLAPVPTPVRLDLRRADSLWVLPDDIDTGDIEPVPTEQRPDWVLRPEDVPAVGERIEPAAAPRRTGSGPYVFSCEAGGEPVRWPPSVTVPYRVRSDCALPKAMGVVRRCLQHLADCTGRSFEFAGTFTGLPQLRTTTLRHVDIAWAFDDEYREHERGVPGIEPGSTIGLGAPELDRADGRLVLVGGSALVNADLRVPEGMERADAHAHVLLHEIGHVMNLGHVSAPGEVMQATAALELQRYGPGDRAGLERVLAWASQEGG